MEAIIARLRDRASHAPKPDLASLDTAALSSVARAVVDDVEHAAKGVDVDLEMWFASLSALITEHGGSLSMEVPGSNGDASPRSASPLRLLRAQSSKRLGSVPSALLHSPTGTTAALALANPQSPLHSGTRGSPRDGFHAPTPTSTTQAAGVDAVPEVI